MTGNGKNRKRQVSRGMFTMAGLRRAKVYE